MAQYIGGETGVRHETLTRRVWLRAGAGNETIKETERLRAGEGNETIMETEETQKTQNRTLHIRREREEERGAQCIINVPQQPIRGA